MIKRKDKLEHSRDEMKENDGSEEVADEETRDSLIEPGVQGMRRWNDHLLLPTAQERQDTQ